MNQNQIMGAYRNQYTDQPIDSPDEPIHEPSSEKPKEDSKNFTKYSYVAIGLVLIVIISLVIMSISKTNELGNTINNTNNSNSSAFINETAQGNKNETTNQDTDLTKNGICNPGENCYDNPTECKCNGEEYCPVESKVCTNPICGNGNCETGEGIDNCCDDCGCSSPDCEICNKANHVCQIPEANISDQAVINAVTNYYQANGYTIENITLQNSTCTNSQRSKSVSVKLTNDEFMKLVRVTEAGEVSVLSTW
jgi:hypothetical protein